MHPSVHSTRFTHRHYLYEWTPHDETSKVILFPQDKQSCKFDCIHLQRSDAAIIVVMNTSLSL